MFNFDRQFVICIILIVLAILFILLTKMLVLCFRRNNCFYRKIQNMDKTHTMSERRAIKKSLDIIMENTYKGIKTPDNLMAPGKIIEKEFSEIDFDDNGFIKKIPQKKRVFCPRRLGSKHVLRKPVTCGRVFPSGILKNG